MFLTLEHKKFDVYLVSHELLLECYKLVIKLPNSELFNLVQQIRRASLSIKLNIAEGSSRKSPIERRRFYEIARGSVIEIDSAFEVCVALKYLHEEELQTIGILINRCFSMLSKMIWVNNQFSKA